jgi:hypothetical protein
MNCGELGTDAPDEVMIKGYGERARGVKREERKMEKPKIRESNVMIGCMMIGVINLLSSTYLFGRWTLRRIQFY